MSWYLAGIRARRAARARHEALLQLMDARVALRLMEQNAEVHYRDVVAWTKWKEIFGLTDEERVAVVCAEIERDTAKRVRAYVH
ncbi:hypothetical protein [Nocardia sp. NPDC051570]|uniref:hypothetical protein n=1 Tax=Nocardia sp. NPDC051570 TaxID=3364324 RepID=UPI0037B78709